VTLRLITAVLAWLALTASAASAQGPARPMPGVPVQTGHVELQLLSADTVAAPGETAWVALSQSIAPGWHTYWRNSGDAGQPTQIVWSLPPGATVGAPVWPTPRRMREASLMTYGYQGQVVTAIPVHIAKSVPPGTVLTLTARVDLLVCKDLCIPEGADLAVQLPVGDAVEQDPTTGRKITDALLAAPKPAPFNAAAKVEHGMLELAFTGPVLKRLDPTGAYFFPDDPKALDEPSRQAVERGPTGFTLMVKAGPGAANGLSRPLTGVLSVAGHAFEVSARPGPLPAGASGLGAVPSADEAPAPKAKPAGVALGFLAALGLGLLGGVVLNLMPCVFPVLAIKAAALARVAGHGKAHARAHGLAFAVGVVLTFVLLAAGLIGLRAAGQAVGWGFQLQSPPVTAGLSLLMLAVALNLSGVFEAGLSAQRAAGQVATGNGLAGAFGTGVLAVLVAAPCTAPFMAVAIGYALTASAPLALCVFAAMGVGLALPFAILSFSPALLNRLPRPGAWMQTLRHVLAFPMYGAAAWLTWVFAQQLGAEALGVLFAAAVALAFALYLFGGAQRREADGAAGVVVGLLAAGVFTAAAVFLAAVAASAPAQGQGAVASSEVDRSLAAEPYSPTRLAELRSQGRPVFVNFTAAWCVTCKVNERVALSQPEVKAAFARTHTAYLVGDWTRRDATIARTLAEHGRAGVPLYLLYSPGTDQPQVLPQILTPDTLVRALQAQAGQLSVQTAPAPASAPAAPSGAGERD
jgi:thiol:disulfide interchange protein DsbD